jgi:hypothetical protein
MSAFERNRTVRRSCAVLVLAWISVFLFSAGAVRGQSDSSIVQWGSMVIVEPSALEHIMAVAGGGYNSLGLKSDGTIVAWGDN